MTKSNDAKIAALKKAIEEYQTGEHALVDVQLEQQKAEVKRRALLLLDQRARSQHELRTRLLALEFPAELVELALEDLQRVGLINDAEFATSWVHQRRNRRGKSKRALRMELQQKGVDARVQQEVLDEISDEQEHELALEFARKKVRTLKDIPTDWEASQKQLRKVVGYLARRGFPEGMSIAVAKQALDER